MIDAVFEKHDKAARQKVCNDRTANFPPIREASWWQFKIPEYFPQPSHKHELGENKLRSQAKKIFSVHNQTCSANGTASQSNMQDTSQACEQKGGAEQSICIRMASTKIEWILQNSYSYFDL